MIDIQDPKDCCGGTACGRYIYDLNASCLKSYTAKEALNMQPARQDSWVGVYGLSKKKEA